MRVRGNMQSKSGQWGPCCDVFMSRKQISANSISICQSPRSRNEHNVNSSLHDAVTYCSAGSEDEYMTRKYYHRLKIHHKQVRHGSIPPLVSPFLLLLTQFRPVLFLLLLGCKPTIECAAQSPRLSSKGVRKMDSSFSGLSLDMYNRRFM